MGTQVIRRSNSQASKFEDQQNKHGFTKYFIAEKKILPSKLLGSSNSIFFPPSIKL